MIRAGTPDQTKLLDWFSCLNKIAKPLTNIHQTAVTKPQQYPGAPPSVQWEDGMVGLKCAPPPLSARPKPTDVAARCPKLATLAELLLREETFEALPWQYQGQDSKVCWLGIDLNFGGTIAFSLM